MSHFIRATLAVTASLTLGIPALATPVLPGGGTLSGTVAILSEGSIEYADDVSIDAAGVTIAVGAVEYLVVGGGGGGGTSTDFSGAGSGGGGAGGLVVGVLDVLAESCNVTVGAGGAAGEVGNYSGADGEDSQLGPITALGGGGGIGGTGSGRDGGSGGGGRAPGDTGGAALQPGSASGGFGNPGGGGYPPDLRGGGGGGGAGSAGEDVPEGGSGGAGGAGMESSITGEVSHYAAGGGGGGVREHGIGAGGIGGGGSGANNNIAATAGVPNTGSGGGGGNNSRVGADGGSGVVYIRYAGDGAVSSSGDEISQLGGDYEGYTLHAFTTTGDSAFQLNNDNGVSLRQQATLAGNLSGDGELNVVGPGTLTLSGDNTYSGGTTVSGGTLSISSTEALPDWDTAGGFSVADGAILAVGNNVTDGQFNTMRALDDNFEPGAAIGFDSSEGERTVSSAIDGDLRLAKVGSNILRLTGTNTFTGGTIVTGGTLRIQSDRALGAAPEEFTADNVILDGGILKNHPVSITLDANRGITLGPNHGTIEVRTPDEIVVPGVITGPGDLIKIDGGKLVLSGANTYGGSTRIRRATIALDAGDDRLPITTNLDFADRDDATFDLNGYNQQVASLSGGGSGGGYVVNTGSGTSVLTIHPDDDTTFYGLIEGDIRMAVTGDKASPSYSAPRQRLRNADNSYTGGTLIDGGTLLVRYDGALGKLPDEFEPAHITLQNNGVLFHDSDPLSIHENRGITLGEGGGGLSAGWSRIVTINSQISGGADARLTILGNSGTVVFTGNNTYAGETRLASSTSRLQIGDGGTSGSLGTGNVVNNGELMFNRSDELLVPNAISGSGTLTQAGPGTTVLSGDNTYSGGTTVSAGTLLVNNTSGSGTGSGPVAVEEDARLGGTGTIGGVTTVESGGALAPGASIGTLNFLDELILDAGAVFEWEFTEAGDAGDAGEHYDLVIGPKLALPESGQLDLRIFAVGDYTLNAGDSFMLFEGDVYQAGGEEPLAAGYDVTSLFDFSDDFNWWGTWEVAANVPGYDLPGNLMLTAVPEPGGALLLLAALACGLLMRRRR